VFCLKFKASYRKQATGSGLAFCLSAQHKTCPVRTSRESDYGKWVQFEDADRMREVIRNVGDPTEPYVRLGNS
jgi:hypothetical protein